MPSYSNCPRCRKSKAVCQCIPGTLYAPGGFSDKNWDRNDKCFEDRPKAKYPVLKQPMKTICDSCKSKIDSYPCSYCNGDYTKKRPWSRGSRVVDTVLDWQLWRKILRALEGWDKGLEARSHLLLDDWVIGNLGLARLWVWAATGKSIDHEKTCRPGDHFDFDWFLSFSDHSIGGGKKWEWSLGWAVLIWSTIGFL